MNTREVTVLLSLVTAYDNRNADKATLAAWTKASEIGRWTPEEANAAVHAHYAESTAFLMPAHVTERIRAHRRTVTEAEHSREVLEDARQGVRLAMVTPESSRAGDAGGDSTEWLVERFSMHNHAGQPVASEVQRAAHMRAIRDLLPKPAGPEIPELHIELARKVKCEWCGARELQPCTMPRRGRWVSRSTPHPSRVEAGLQAAGLVEGEVIEEAV